MVVAEHQCGLVRQSVIVDPDAGTVTFRDCHHQRRFLTWGADAEYTCRLSELRGVCWSGEARRGRALEIVTPAGRASLPADAAGFESAHAALSAGLRPDARLRWHERSRVRFLLFRLIGLALVPAGLVVAVLIAVLVERGLVPQWLVDGLLLGGMALFVIIPVAALAHAWRRSRRRT